MYFNIKICLSCHNISRTLNVSRLWEENYLCKSNASWFYFKNIYRVDTMERIDCMLICCMSHATITKLKGTSAKSKNNNGHLENILSILYLIDLLMKDITKMDIHHNENLLIFQEYHNHVRIISGKNIQHNYVVKIGIIV